MCKVSSTVFQCLRTPLANENEAGAVRHVDVKVTKVRGKEGRDGGRSRDDNRVEERSSFLRKNVQSRFHSVSVS